MKYLSVLLMFSLAIMVKAEVLPTTVGVGSGNGTTVVVPIQLAYAMPEEITIVKGASKQVVEINGQDCLALTLEVKKLPITVVLKNGTTGAVATFRVVVNKNNPVGMVPVTSKRKTKMVPNRVLLFAGRPEEHGMYTSYVPPPKGARWGITIDGKVVPIQMRK